jgi:outer membrane receptor protein involved in Fe transport
VELGYLSAPSSLAPNQLALDDVAGVPTANNRTLPDASDTAVSPRAAVLYRVSDRVSAFGSIGSGFRAPTLNELYRQFRVGTILTLANDQLGRELDAGLEFVESHGSRFGSFGCD